MLADVFLFLWAAREVRYCMELCMGEERKEVFRGVATLEEEGIELLCFVLCIRWINTETVELEDSVEDEVMQLAIGVC